MALASEPEKLPLFARRRVRLALVGLVGLYLFMICVAYWNRTPVRPGLSFAVLGPTVVEPKSPFPLRVVGYQHGTHAPARVWVDAAVIRDPEGDRTLDVSDLMPGSPIALLFVGTATAPRTDGPFEVRLDLRGEDGRVRELPVPLTVYDTLPSVTPEPMPLPSEVPVSGGLCLDIMTEGPGLAMAQANRIWLRVVSREGKPVSGASVRWTIRGADPGKGTAETDAAGLAPVVVTPENLSTFFRFEAERAGLQGSLETQLRPLGRGVMLWADRLLQAAGEEPIAVTAVRATDDALYCDLYRGDAWIRTWQYPAAKTDEAIVVDLPEPGTYHFQCYSHFALPGESGDSMLLFRSEQPRVRAMADLLRSAPSSGRTRTYLQDVPIVGEDAQNALMASYRSLTLDVHEPALLAGTRKVDVEAAAMANDRIKARYFILIGASFALVIFWAIWYAFHTAIEARRRYAEELADLGELAVPVPPPTRLMRARLAVQIGFIITVLVLNVLAMLELFKYL